jgi:hypothetical protein
MDLASAYPNSDMSALSMTLIAVVMTGTLAAWLILVFLADRQPRRQRSQAGQAGIESWSTERPGLADNDHNELGERPPAEHPGVAA